MSTKKAKSIWIADLSSHGGQSPKGSKRFIKKLHTLSKVPSCIVRTSAFDNVALGSKYSTFKLCKTDQQMNHGQSHSSPPQWHKNDAGRVMNSSLRGRCTFVLPTPLWSCVKANNATGGCSKRASPGLHSTSAHR